MSESQLTEFTTALRQHAEDYEIRDTGIPFVQLGEYFSLLMKWNDRLHLIAPVSAAEFATRHVLESLTLLKYLPIGAAVADVGSGGGLPIIPCLLARKDVTATLIEANKKKAVFLREALRELNLKARTQVIGERFESFEFPGANVLTCRALEQFKPMLPQLVSWAGNATLLLFGGNELGNALKSLNRSIVRVLMPKSKQRFLFIVK